jgi:hypothetical protein
MSLQRLLVTDFSFGQVSPRFAGKITTEIRTRAVEHIGGFVLNPDGGLRRRRGSVYVRDGVGITPTTNRLYDSDGVPSFAIYRSGTNRRLGFIQDSPRAWLSEQLPGTVTQSITDASLEAGKPLGSTRSFYDVETAAEHIHFWTDDDAFSIDISTLTSLSRLSLLDLAAVHQGRLLSVRRDNGHINMSEVQDFFDFVDDEDLNKPLTAIADFAGIETPKWIAARQSVYVGTDEAEYEVYSGFPVFSEELGGLMVRRITEIGTEEATYFGPSLAVRDISEIMLVNYAGEGFTYQAVGLTDRIDNNRLVHMEAVEFGTHRYLLALDVDGTLWAYLSSPASGVDGWVTLATDIGWVWTYNKDVYVAVERDGAYSVEVLPLDELSHPGARTRRQDAMFYANDAYGDRGGFLTIDASSLVGDELPPLTLVSLYDINLTTKVSGYVDDIATDASGDIAMTLTALQSLLGWTTGEKYLFAHQAEVYATGTIRTLPLGGIIGAMSRIAYVILQVEHSSGAKVRVNGGTWEEHTTATPENGVWKFRVEHATDEEPRVEIATVDQRPLGIYQILVEVDVGGV